MLFTSLSTFISVTLLANLASAFDASANTNLAVYWGQNAGGNQQRLSDYCSSNSADIIILSFLNDFPNLGLNFANACGTTFANSTLLHCPTIGADIKTCQQQGKKVLLSLGGAYGTYGFTSDSEAEAFSTVLWNKFGAGTGDSQRPFDDAIVDGFDFDLEHQQQTGFVALANALNTIYATQSTKYYLSASPQCPYPDQSVGDVLSQAHVDFAFIQFYNNDCSVDKTFNWDSWKSFATSVSPNKDIKLYLGVPGTPSIAGYVTPDVIKEQLALIQSGPNFGGVSIWDASFATNNIQTNGGNFLQNVRLILNAFVAPTSSASSVVSTSAPASSGASSAPASSAVTTAPATSAASSGAAGSSGASSAPVSSAAAGTVTATNIATTVITITSCSHHKCTAVPVTTGVVTVVEVDTTYTTYCPLSTVAPSSTSSVAPVSSAPGTVTKTDVATTVITITSCSDHKCTAVPVTTGLTVVTLVDTIYTTYCPLATESTSAVSTIGSVSATTVAPVSSVQKTTVPVTSAPVTVAPVVTPYPSATTVVVSTYVAVNSTSAGNTTAPAVSTFVVNGAVSNNAKYGFAVVACGLAMLI